ncbi:MAG: High-affinity nickel-transporter [Geodermatophilaceae bacterium]|nr:High-affinity nickel-transporter [Geodermatophilaceae bacterium]
MNLAGRLAVILTPAVAVVLLSAGPAAAHPLGNFTVNHYNGISLFPDRVDVLAIVDTAEIPSAQQLPDIDTDDSGSPSAGELAAAAAVQCRDVAAAVSADVDGAALRWTVTESTLETLPGVAGLPTLRLTCPLSAPAELSAAATLSFVDEFRADRVGWHEITATGRGIRLIDPPVPSETVSDQLRSYPNDLLSSPLGLRSVTLQTEPGEGSAPGSVALPTGSSDPFTSLVASADRKLTELIGPDLTPLVGALALLLAVLLGAGHALLPGHGKTVMAAYLAGRRGSPKDAVVVGATVTVTHTAGVLVLGLLITVFSNVAGEQVLRWLGVASGILVACIGAGLLRSALRSRRAHVVSTAPRQVALVGAPGVAHDHPAHVHPAHDHDAHDHAVPGHVHGVDHDHDDSHGHGGHAHSHGGFGHAHSHGYGRRGLVGMGIAGGMVPSPSALVVLLASIALGRTIFGVLLVLAYGLGMAGVLTAVGLLLVRLRGRLSRLGETARLRRTASWLSATLPLITASLVLVVGLALALRGLVSPV